VENLPEKPYTSEWMGTRNDNAENMNNFISTNTPFTWETTSPKAELV
jgi:hypothetical protein